MNIYTIICEWRCPGIAENNVTYELSANTKREALNLAAHQFYSEHIGFYVKSKLYKGDNILEHPRVVGPRGNLFVITFTII